jgi:hypothetical protein
MTWLRGRGGSARRGQTVETPHAVDQFVEVVFAEGGSFEHASLDSGVGHVDQALEDGNFGGIHSTHGLLSEPDMGTDVR